MKKMILTSVSILVLSSSSVFANSFDEMKKVQLVQVKHQLSVFENVMIPNLKKFILCIENTSSEIEFKNKCTQYIEKIDKAMN